MQSKTFDSSDVGQIEEFVSKLYSRMHIGAVGESTRAQITRRVLAPGIGFDDLDYTFDIGYDAEPQDLLIICDVVSNTIRRDSEGSEETFGPGDQFLICQPDLPYAGIARATRLRFTVLDPAVLAQVAAATESDPTEPVRLLDHRPLSRAAALRLQRGVAHVRNNVMAGADAPPAPLVASAARQYVAAMVLDAYPNTASTGPVAGNRRDADPPTLQRAVAFIEANPDLDISLADIANAAYVTPRALQLAFRRHLNTTPMAYLRRVRLDHAHADLRAATAGDGSTVTDIAARWGFTSTRFTYQYRAAYGETPGQTLHR